MPGCCCFFTKSRPQVLDRLKMQPCELFVLHLLSQNQQLSYTDFLTDCFSQPFFFSFFLSFLLLFHHLCWSQGHFSMLVVPASPPPAIPKTNSTLRPHPQETTDQSLVGCHPKETLYCRGVNSVVLSNACSDSAYKGHHLLHPLLMTMLANSQSDSESRPPLHPSTNPPMWTLLLRALNRTALDKDGGRNIKTEATMRVWHEGPQKLWLFLMQWLMMMITDETTWHHASCHNYPGVKQAQELHHLQCVCVCMWGGMYMVDYNICCFVCWNAC